jgi:D-alanyl-D-alanine carboxypeptidase
MTTRSRAARAVATLAMLAIPAVAVVPAAVASPAPPARGADVGMLQLLDTLRHKSSAPGAGFTFGDGQHEVTLSVGTRDVGGRHPIESTDKVRVGSDTKMFVASVVLQLVDEGRLVLDVPVEQYLPGVLRYPADKVPGDPATYDGRAVTLRQLLQHTSGVPDYGSDYAFVLNPVHQIIPPTPQDIVTYALAKGPTHRPGASWAYSNTDYTLIGMLVQARTGRSIGTEIAERVVKRLGLRNTFFAEPGQKALPGEHVHGYLTELVPLDLTGFEPAVWGAAGALVSSPDDMNTFISALLAGDVVPPAQLAAMQHTVPYAAGGYGLGLVSVPLSCGLAWGHSGLVAGYQTFGLGLPDGRHGFLTLNSTYAVNLIPPSNPASAYDLFDRALC